jgi:hypothetical protein
MFFSCELTANQDRNSISKNDSIPNRTFKNELTKEQRQKQDEENNRIDSLHLDIALNHAFKIAQREFKNENFKKEYEIQPDDSSFIIKVEILIGSLFKDNQKYFLLRRHVPWATFLDLYKIQDDKTEKLIYREQGSMTYVNDTIRDINGDGLNDFVVNWYGSSGCCLKAFSNVYLLRQDKKSFSENFEFINPTFSPKEKIIRGVCYGHPGETEMYKYKWNGEKVDTLEYVSYERNEKGKTGKIIITTGRPYGDKFKTLKVLNSVPKEYERIEGFDWFTGKGYE